MEHQSIYQGGLLSKDGNLDNAGNMVSEDISQVEKKRYKREDPDTILQATTQVKEASSRFQAEDSSPIATKAISNANETEAKSVPATESKLEENVATAPKFKVMETTMPSTSSYFGGVTKLFNILIALVAFAIVVLSYIAIAVTRMCCKKTYPAGQSQENRWAIPWHVCCVKYKKESEERLPIVQDSTSQSGEII